MTASSSIDSINRRAGLLELAADLGLAEAHAGRRPSFSCPACGSEKRHTRTHDKRGACGLTTGGEGWRCFQCDAGGDAVDLIAYSLAGSRFRQLATPDRRRVFEWAGDRGYCERRGEAGGRVAVVPLKPARPIAPPAPPVRPPPLEVANVWNLRRERSPLGSVPVTADPQATAWCEARNLVAEHIAALDLARVIPAGSGPVLPRWTWGKGGQWTTTGHRLVLPLFDAAGEMRSLHARCLDPAFPDNKGASPCNPGGQRNPVPNWSPVSGLVLADGLAQWMLGSPKGLRFERVVIVEGAPDYLSWATRYAHLDSFDDLPAVLGVISGSWSPEVAARIPDGARVTVRTHHDDAGHKYAAAIADTLADRCTVMRSKPAQEVQHAAA